MMGYGEEGDVVCLCVCVRVWVKVKKPNNALSSVFNYLAKSFHEYQEYEMVAYMRSKNGQICV